MGLHYITVEKHGSLQVKALIYSSMTGCLEHIKQFTVKRINSAAPSQDALYGTAGEAGEEFTHRADNAGIQNTRPEMCYPLSDAQ